MGSQAMLINGVNTTLSDTTIEEFKTAMRGPVITPESTGFDDVRQIWNGMHDKRPAIITRCTGTADVIDAVNFAREHNLLVAVRGGGHNVAGSASCDGGIMIDLSLMTGVHVDAANKTARVQGGATWGDVDRETQVHGLATAGGVVSTTGVAGLTLGGGLGWLRRKHGLTIDNILSVDIVTANGDFLTASETENADLFWGIRGGGGNFGIITSFEFKLHALGPTVALALPWYQIDSEQHAHEMLSKWRDFMATAPDEISSQAMFWTVPPAPILPEAAHGKRAFIVGAVYSGDPAEGERVLQPLRELGTPHFDLSGQMPWVAIQQLYDPFLPKGDRLYYFKSRNMDNLHTATIDALLPNALNPISPFVLIVIWRYGGAMSRVAIDTTAFRGRDAAYLFSVDAIWDDPAESDDVIAWSRNYLKELDAHFSQGSYVNFAGFGEEGEDLVKDAYGSHYDRLVRLKNKYDPTNLFRLNQNIKPTTA